MKYYSDGTNLYEVASQCVVKNFGRTKGTISYTILRDVVSGSEARVGDLDLMALVEVQCS